MRKFLFILLPVCSVAQTTFQNSYDLGYDEDGYIHVLPDSTYALTGEVTQTPGARSLLMRFDQYGNAQSAQSYSLGSAGQGALFGNGIPLSNGGFWFCINGSTNGLTNSNRIMQTDANGNVVYTGFQKLAPNNSEIFADAIQTSDGYIVGTSASYMAPNYSSPAISIFKMDTLGNLAWNIGIETDTVTPKESPISIIETSDGNYVVCGRSMNPVNGSMDCYVIKVTPAGNVLWKKLYGTPSYELGSSVQELSDGNMLVSGLTATASTQNSFLMKIDPNGNLLWTKIYTISYPMTWFYQLIVKSDQEVIVFGQGGTSASVPVLGSLDTAGNVHWMKYYSLPGSAGCFNAALTPDNGYVFTCELTDTIAPFANDIVLVKTDSVGKSDCLGSLYNCAYIPGTFTELPYGWVITGGVFISDTTSISVLNASTAQLCSNESGIDEEQVDVQLQFQNPTGEKLFLRASKPMKQVNIISASGQLVRSETPNDTVTFTAEMPAAGIYLVTVTFEDGTIITRKVIRAAD